MKEPGKAAFKKTWPLGYGENFEVYEAVTGGREEDIVEACLNPFGRSDGAALEIGCGTGFWVNKYLLPAFKEVYGLDVIPREWVQVDDPRFIYVEVPDRDYSCWTIPDESIDFVWSFGCFCHLTLNSISQYLKSTIRVLKPGGRAALYFSNTERRPATATKENADYDPESSIIWCNNNWQLTHDMMRQAGFVNIRDLMPEHKDTLAYGERL